jgi:hypothetical protein
MQAKLTSAQVKALSEHLGGKPMAAKMPPLKTAGKKIDAEDLADGGIDEASEDIKKYK